MKCLACGSGEGRQLAFGEHRVCADCIRRAASDAERTDGTCVSCGVSEGLRAISGNVAICEECIQLAAEIVGSLRLVGLTPSLDVLGSRIERLWKFAAKRRALMLRQGRNIDESLAGATFALEGAARAGERALAFFRDLSQEGARPDALANLQWVMDLLRAVESLLPDLPDNQPGSDSKSAQEPNDEGR